LTQEPTAQQAAPPADRQTKGQPINYRGKDPGKIREKGKPLSLSVYWNKEKKYPVLAIGLRPTPKPRETLATHVKAAPEKIKHSQKTTADQRPTVDKSAPAKMALFCPTER
jgi:hypothetical protein